METQTTLSTTMLIIKKRNKKNLTKVTKTVKVNQIMTNKMTMMMTNDVINVKRN